ncbi:MAG: DUF86 domain-containing protein [Candidatus Hydrogenedentota bacterium]
MLLDSDETRLRHMVEAAREAVSYVEGITRHQFDSERPLQHSVIRCIEIIGEAASRLTPELREATPGIPWTDIIGMRNRIVHAYFDIDLDIIWQTVRHELPAMLPRLEALLPQGKD